MHEMLRFTSLEGRLLTLPLCGRFADSKSNFPQAEIYSTKIRELQK